MQNSWKGLRFNRLEFPSWRLPALIARHAVILERLVWIVFLFGITTSARPLLPGVYNLERYFWFPADLAVIVWFVARSTQAINVVLQNKLLMSWGLLAVLSFFWSLTPGQSLYEGAQLAMTILVGLFLATGKTRIEVLKLFFIALLMVEILSFLLVLLNPGEAIDVNGAWQGALTHKNVFGSLMVLQVITALCLFMSGWRRFLTGGVTLSALFLLAMSRSGTSLIACLLVMTFVPVAYAYMRNQKTLPLFIGVVLIAASSLVAMVALLEIDALKFLLVSLGKDPTLTGRTEIWAFGLEALNNHLWFGHGFKAYWHSPFTTYGNLQYVLRQELWSFHNSYLEVGVSFGLVGLALMLVTLVLGFSLKMRNFLVYKSFILLWPVLIILFIMLFMMGESAIFVNHSDYQFVLVVAMASRKAALHSAAARVS